MPNTFLKPSTYARTALSILQTQLVLGRLVSRDAEGEFQGGVGNTVSIKIRDRIPAKTIAYGETVPAKRVVQATDLNETKVDVKLTDHFYTAVNLSEEDMNLEIEEFGAQVLAPMTIGVGEALEANIAAQLNAFTAACKAPAANADKVKLAKMATPIGLDPALSAGKVVDTLIDAAVLMDKLDIPRTGRVAILSPDLLAVVLKDDRLIRADASGSTEALRSATVGELEGFTVHVSNMLTGGTGVCMIREAFSLVTRAPKKPEGATFAASESHQGFALRYLRDYDPTTLTDRVVVSSFAGSATITGAVLPYKSAEATPANLYRHTAVALAKPTA